MQIGADQSERWLDGEKSRQLNIRERQLIKLVSEGMKNREIAEAMCSTEHMVKNYIRVIYDKLGMWNRVELALWYLSHQGN